MRVKKDHRGCSNGAERAVDDCNLRTARRSSLYSDHRGYFFLLLCICQNIQFVHAQVRAWERARRGEGGCDRLCVLWEATGIMDVMTQHQDSSEPHNSHHDGWRQSGRWPNSLSSLSSTPPPLSPHPFSSSSHARRLRTRRKPLSFHAAQIRPLSRKKIHQYVLVKTTTLSSLFRLTSYCAHSCVLQAAIPHRRAPSSACSFPGPLEESFKWSLANLQRMWFDDPAMFTS